MKKNNIKKSLSLDFFNDQKSNEEPYIIKSSIFYKVSTPLITENYDTQKDIKKRENISTPNIKNCNRFAVTELEKSDIHAFNNNDEEPYIIKSSIFFENIKLENLDFEVKSMGEHLEKNNDSND